MKGFNSTRNVITEFIWGWVSYAKKTTTIKADHYYMHGNTL